MEVENKIKNDEMLYKSLESYRLRRNLAIIEEKMEANSPKDYSNESNVFKKGFGNVISNPLKKNIVRDLSEAKKLALDNIDSFERTNGQDYSENEEELKEKIADYFLEDKKNEAKIMLALRLALSNEYKIFEEEATLKDISRLLFDNDDKIKELIQELKNNYFKICKQDFRSLDKEDYVGLGIASLASLLLGPIGLGIAKEKSKSVSKALEDAAKTKGLGVAAVTVSAITMNVLLIGATAGAYTAYELRKNEELKKEYRSISPDNLALRFSIKATLIEEIKKQNVDIVPYIDDALHVLDDFRADAEYMMIVEKLDCKNAKKKISVCNNLSMRLAEIVGI